MNEQIDRIVLCAKEEMDQAASQAVLDKINIMKAELKAAMFLTGCACVDELRQRRVIVSGRTADWLTASED
jgi:isopentenyl diphosphate isomerase/L-lactate dehydrogenase-like FMN-dependent dehydrogenase